MGFTCKVRLHSTSSIYLVITKVLKHYKQSKMNFLTKQQQKGQYFLNCI